MNKGIRISIIGAALLSLSACVSMPDFGDNPPPPEIAAEIAQNRAFPDVRNAPSLPTDIRGSAQWEGAVKNLTGQSNVFDKVNADAPIPSQADIRAQIAAKKSYVDGHYIDDPK